MKFKCFCGSNHYELTSVSLYNYATEDPLSQNMLGSQFHWSATCEICGKTWGNYFSKETLTEVMYEAGVLK